MDTEPNYYAHLVAEPEVTALAGQRIHAQQIPQQTRESPRAYPCVVFSTISRVRDPELCGASEVVQATVQMDTYGMTRAEVLALARAIRRRMVDYSGLMGTVDVQRVLTDTEFDVGPDPEPGLYRRTQTFNVWHVET